MNDELTIIRYAALLHDIGKFWQRTGKNEKHNNLSEEFCKTYLNVPHKEEIAVLVSNHHAPTHDLSKILQMADHISAAERYPLLEDEAEVQVHVPSEPLISIFSKINIGNGETKEHYHHITDLELERERIFPKQNKNAVTIGTHQYKALWSNKGFIPETMKINGINFTNTTAYFTTIYYLLKKYTSFIPSAVYKSIPDISLFDHLRTTCAIADCLYKTKNVDRFLLIHGDISGIQNFIYNIHSPEKAQKGMSKRLRGRSFYLTLLSESLSHYITMELNLTISNILWCGGGHFYILAPDNEITHTKLRETTKKINEWLLTEHQGNLYLVIGVAKGNGEQLSKNFSDLMDEASQEAKKGKYKKFFEINVHKRIFGPYEAKKVCNVCGLEISEWGILEGTCKNCDKHESIGGALPDTQYLIEVMATDTFPDIITSGVNSVIFNGLNTCWFLCSSEKEVKRVIENVNKSRINVGAIYRLNNTDFIKTVDLSPDMQVGLGFKFIGNVVPRSQQGVVMTFEEIAEKSGGSALLGILRMDVDNLGKVFIFGFSENKSISRISTLSRSLDLFFLGYLNNICREKDLYIVYSGGDDVFIVGPWDKIIETSLEIHSEFKEFTCRNPNLTISGGIVNCKHKFPIGRAATIGGERLEQAKGITKDKNAITLFNDTVKWESDGSVGKNGLRELLELAKFLQECVQSKDKKLSHSFIYSLLGMWNSTFYDIFEKEGYISQQHINRKRYMPYLKYSLIRNVDKKNHPELFDKLDKELPSYMPWIRLPVNWVSLKERGE